jgi:hypothetical protein
MWIKNWIFTRCLIANGSWWNPIDPRPEEGLNRQMVLEHRETIATAIAMMSHR